MSDRRIPWRRSARRIDARRSVDVVRLTGPARKPIDRCPSSTRWSTARRSPTSFEKPTSGLPSACRASRTTTPPAASTWTSWRATSTRCFAVAQTAGGEQDRVDLHRPQLAQVVQLLGGIAIGVADERHVAVGVRLVLDATCDLAEVLVHHVVDHHGNGLGAAARQTAGQHVGLEVERSRRLEHLRPRRLGDGVRRAAQHARHRGRRDHREGGHVLERRHVSLLPTSCRRRGRARSARVR